jgi:enoyl-CoA hydratase/carnithine racemase
MYTGDLVDAAQAREMRLINKVVPADQLALETDKLARKMARMPVPALKYTKASLNNQQMVAGLLSSFQYNIEAIAALHSTKQGREWMRNLATMSLKEYLNFRDSPFAGLD